jgi:hypothetical protein
MVLMNMRLLKYPASKWLKHRVLAGDNDLKRHLPDTKLLTGASLLEFVRKYPFIILKPVIGGGGHGVIKIAARGERADVLTAAGRSYRGIRIKGGLVPLIRSLTRGRHYLVQQGISLLTIQGRPVDFRVLLLKPGQEWQTMGIMGKWAARNKIVTNHCRGGRAIVLDKALKLSKSLTDEQCTNIENQMLRTSKQMAERMNEYFRNVRELGLDIAIDQNLQLWLLEANTRPQFDLFREHPNKDLYPEIRGIIRKLRTPIRPFRAKRKTG